MASAEIEAGRYDVALVLGVEQMKTVDPATGGDFSSLKGVMRLFDSEIGTFVGWVHYLCFDLFVGRWIMNDAPQGGYRLAPVLFLTLMFGPAGLLSYLIGRSFFRAAANA